MTGSKHEPGKQVLIRGVLRLDMPRTKRIDVLEVLDQSVRDLVFGSGKAQVAIGLVRKGPGLGAEDASPHRQG